ncbi:MAG TPA: hypothetical protein VEC56_12740 [Candidatus Krumholzibacteria bacterium]|nr:hypothetical protein [Candidatus Krumholzibacteria bacterium]
MSRRFIIGFALALAALSASSARAGELIVNGGFEAGGFGTSWVHGARQGNTQNPALADHVVALDLPYAGNYSALLGFKYVTQGTNRYGYMYQDVAIPAGVSAATLNFKIRMQGYDSDFYDPFYVDVRTTGNAQLERVLFYAFSEWNNIYKDSGWLFDDNVLPVGHNMTAYAGQTIRLYFEQANLIDALYETWTYVDDVSLVYRMWVDLAVDGNGDDVFGALGSGNGGTSIKSGVAGDTLSYDVRVENEGTVADTYRLTATAPIGWSAFVDLGGVLTPLPYVTPSMALGSSTTYRIVVIPPVAAGNGSYSVILNAQSTVQASRVDSARLRADIVSAVLGSDLTVNGNGVGVIGDNGAGGFALTASPWDTTVPYTVVVRNTGNAASAFSVAWTNDPNLTASVVYNATTYNAPFTTASIPAGGTATMTLNLRVASPNPGGDYTNILTATSTGDTTKRDSIKSILRLLAPRVDMIVATSGDNIYGATGTGLGGGSSNAGERGTQVQFPIIVQNESALADSFTLTWTAPAAGWTAVIEIGGVNRNFPVITPRINAFSQASYTLRVSIPGGAAYGTYRSVMNAASRVDNRITESISASISVATPSEIDMTIDGQGLDVYGPIGTGLGGTSIRTVSPGQTTVFSVVIQNVSGVNNFSVGWSAPAGWTVTFNGSATPIASIAAGTYPLSVTVPASSLGGTFDVIVDGRKVDKPFLMDSVTGRVVVIPPAIVDGVIDGNGNDVFGVLGSGAGGASLQVTPAPATLNFTVEIQNQGPTADVYQVTWGAIPAWTALLNGLPSPFTTGSVPAGGSRVYPFSVTVPANEATGSFQYIIDMVSINDPTSFESIAARVDIVGPPRPDLVIDGNGFDVFGPLGSGQGGTSTRSAAPSTVYTSALRVRNAGAFADSMRVQWDVPSGWPLHSVVIGDTAVTYQAPFYTPLLDPGQYVDYIVTVTVPAGANAAHTTIINSWSSRPPNLSESVALVTETRGLVRGWVFDDRDHDGVLTAGDVALGGVLVSETSLGFSVTTAGDGSFAMQVAGDSITVVEQNPPGFVSLSPDTAGPFVIAAGDTVDVFFADIGGLTITSGTSQPGPTGAFVAFAHRVVAGTAGHVDLSATTTDSLAVLAWYFDANANGLLDGPDRPLFPSDGDLDPDGANAGVLHVLLRVSVPAGATPGSTIVIAVGAQQAVTNTSLVLTANATDVVVVVDGSAGRLTMQKTSDRADAAPGDVIEYSVRLFNAGADSLANVILVDPVSSWVDLEANAFGAGLDLEWRPPVGAPVHFTFDPTDPDECEYDTPTRTLRVVLSKNTTFYLAPGEAGVVVYRVRVR